MHHEATVRRKFTSKHDAARRYSVTVSVNKEGTITEVKVRILGSAIGEHAEHLAFVRRRAEKNLLGGNINVFVNAPELICDGHMPLLARGGATTRMHRSERITQIPEFKLSLLSPEEAAERGRKLHDIYAKAAAELFGDSTVVPAVGEVYQSTASVHEFHTIVEIRRYGVSNDHEIRSVNERGVGQITDYRNAAEWNRRYVLVAPLVQAGQRYKRKDHTDTYLVTASSYDERGVFEVTLLNENTNITTTRSWPNARYFHLGFERILACSAQRITFNIPDARIEPSAETVRMVRDAMHRTFAAPFATVAAQVGKAGVMVRNAEMREFHSERQLHALYRELDRKMPNWASNFGDTNWPLDEVALAKRAVRAMRRASTEYADLNRDLSDRVEAQRQSIRALQRHTSNKHVEELKSANETLEWRLNNQTATIAQQQLDIERFEHLDKAGETERLRLNRIIADGLRRDQNQREEIKRLKAVADELGAEINRAAASKKSMEASKRNALREATVTALKRLKKEQGVDILRALLKTEGVTNALDLNKEPIELQERVLRRARALLDA